MRAGWSKTAAAPGCWGGNNSFNTESAASSGTDFGLSINSGTVRLTHVNALAEGNGVYNIVTFHSNTSDKILQIYGVDAKVRTLFSGSTALNSIVENGSDTDATLTLVNPDNRNFGGVIRDGDGLGTLGVTVTGGGQQTFSGANTYTGDTTVTGSSQLTLNFAGTSPEPAPADNIINNVVNESALNMGGGTLRIQGLADTDNSQRFNGLNVSGGYSAINLANATNNTITLSLGDISRASGYVNFNIGTNVATTTTANDPTTGMLGTWATVNGTDWAMNDGSGNIVAFDGYTDVTRLGPSTIADDAASHVRIVNGGTSGPISLGDNPGGSGDGITDIYSLLHSATDGDAEIEIYTFSNPEGVGTLRLAADGAIMLADGAGNLTLGVEVDNGGYLTAGGPSDNTAGTLTFNNFSTTSDIIVNVDIADNGTGVVGLVKNGPGELVLNSTFSTYTGGTRINGGLVTIAADESLGTTPGSFDADNIIMDGGGLRLGGSLNLDDNRGITLLEGGGIIDTQAFQTFYGGEISGVGGFTKSGSGRLYLTSANSYAGETVVSTGVIIVQNDDALGDTAGGTVVGSNGRVTLADGVVVEGETITINGTGGNGGGSSTANYGSGNNGALQAAANSTGTWRGDVVIGTNGARLGGVSNSLLIIDGAIRNGGSNGDQGTVAISTAGAGGVVQLNQSSTYTGDTQMVRGTLRLGIDDALPTGTVLQMSIAASVTELIAFDLNGFDQTIAGLRSGFSEANQVTAANGNQRVINSGATTAKLTVDQDTDTTYQGSIQGNVELEKAGDGRLTLNSAIAATSGATNYTGKTTVSGGILALSGAGDLTGTPWIEVLAGANFDVTARTGGSYTVSNKVLSGTGTFAGTYVVDGSSMIRPGSSASGATVAQAGTGFGTLTFDNLTIAPSATDPRVLMQLGGTNVTVTDFTETAVLSAVSGVGGSSDGLYDQIDVTGSLTTSAGSIIKVEFANGYIAQLGDVFNLVDWVTGPAFSGGFNVNSDLDLSAMEALLENDWFFDTSLFMDHGIIYVVPEPSKALLMCAGLAALLMRRRRNNPARKTQSFATDSL